MTEVVVHGGGVEVLGPAGDVVAHVLAHVAVPAWAPVVTRAANLFDPRYVRWAGEALPRAAWAPASADAPLLAQLLAAAHDGHLLQALLVLFDDEQRLVAALRHEAAVLDDASIRHLASGCRDLVEIFWAVVGLAWPAYREAWHHVVFPNVRRGCDALRGALSEATNWMPILAGQRVRVSHPLGVHARCFARSNVVGAPGGWCGLDAFDLVARVAHEAAVRAAGLLVAERAPEVAAAAHWALTEDLALRSVAARLRGHPLHDAHSRFVASLDARSLVRADDALLVQLIERLDG